MNITLNVTPNPDNTHTISWVATKDEGEKLHAITIGIGIGTWVNPDGTIGSDNRGLYSWHHSNPYNGEPQYNGSVTFDPSAWYPGWSTVTYNASMCQFNEPTSPADQYNCVNAPNVIINSGGGTAAKMSAKKKK